MSSDGTRDDSGPTGGAAEGRAARGEPVPPRGEPVSPRGATAAALIEAGRELFARDGYDATSVRALAERAGVNLGAVTYHFGSKRGLYHAVLEGTLAPFGERVVGEAEGDGEPLDRIDAVVRTYFGFLQEHPELPKFMLRELVSGGPPPPVAAMMKRVAGAVTDLIRAGQEEGSIRRGDPILMALSVISQPVFLALTRPMVRAVTGLDAMDSATHRRVVEHAVAFVRAGFTADPE